MLCLVHRSSRSRWRTLLIVLLTAVVLEGAPESAWSVRVWQSDEGLSNHNVTGVTQTADGYLWIATRTNLARFDGVEIEEYPTKFFVDEPNRGFRAMAPSADGGLWLASDLGVIIHVDSRSSRRFTPEGPLAELVPQSLIEDGEGRLWIVYRGGTMGWLVDGKLVPAPAREVGDVYSASLARDREGRLWFSKGFDVGLWQKGRFQTLVTLPGRPASVRVTPARAGGVWICADLHLYRFEESAGLTDLGPLRPEVANGRPTVLLEDRGGALWVGTWQHGLLRYAGGDVESIPVSDREIGSLTEDREGNLWVGTAGGGLNRVRPRAIGLETVETGIALDALQSVCEDASGMLWGATQSGLLVRRTERGWHALPENEGPPIQGVTCVAADATGAVWIGTNVPELHRWREGRLQSWRRSDGLAGRIHTLVTSRSGEVWIGTQNRSAVYCLRDGMVRTLELPPGIDRIQAMTEDAEGAIWVGAENGQLLRIHDERVSDETERTLPLRKTIRSLYAAPDGALWIGYAGGGIGRMKEGQFGRVLVEHGLPDRDVSQVVADDDGWFWMGSDHGLFKARRQELIDVIEGRASRVHCVRYGRNHGLPNLQAKFGYAPTAFRSRDGRLWLPMRTALAVIEPAKLREDLQPPVALLKAVAVDETTIASYRGAVPVQAGQDLQEPRLRVRIPAGHRRLDFQFTALSLLAPESIHFRYRLEGFDNAWVEAGAERSASYTRLAARDYRFRVVAGDGAGAWSNTGAELAFTVLPFFWQTWWFRSGALAVFAILVAATVRYVSFRRLRRRLELLQHRAAVDKERTRIARDIHDDLGGSLTHMTLLLELTMRDRAAADSVANHARQGLTTARQIIKSLDETVWAVNPRNDTLSHLINYIAECAVEFMNTAGIRCHVDLPAHPPERPVSSDVRHHLFVLVKETLNNIVRHARATEAWLRVVASDESLALIVEDNGQGFACPREEAGADGLRNMRQRMEEIGGEARIESRPGVGTRVSFVYPWPKRSRAMPVRTRGRNGRSGSMPPSNSG